MAQMWSPGRREFVLSRKKKIHALEEEKKEEEQLTNKDREIIKNNKIKDETNKYIYSYVEEHGGWEAMGKKKEEKKE